MTPTQTWIPVARLRKTRGRRGELLGEIYSSKQERADQLKTVILEVAGRRWETTVEELWFHSGVPVFKFAGINSISEAEPWQGADVLISSDHVLHLEEGEYTHASLVGCHVIAAGVDIGVVLELQEYGGPAVLSVQTPEGKEVLIPFVRALCRVIDVVNKRIEADLPDGLLDL